jgi:hypothetical protein
MSESLRNTAWLLLGHIQSLGGVLKLENERLSFEGVGEGLAGVPGFLRFSMLRLERSAKRPGLARALLSYENAVVFDVPVSEIEEMKAPLHRSGIDLHIGGNRYRFSFVRPQNTSDDLELVNLPDAMETTRSWAEALGSRGVPTSGRSMADRRCGNCGQELRLEDRLCPQCGRPGHEAAVVPPPQADVPTPPPQADVPTPPPPRQNQDSRIFQRVVDGVIGCIVLLSLIVAGLAILGYSVVFLLDLLGF